MLLAAACLTLLVARADAQTVIAPATAAVEFNSPDHTGVVPAGELSAGQPMIASYQGMIFPVGGDVSSGTPVSVGPVIAKSVVSTIGSATPSLYRLTFSQLGIQVPPCTTVTCASYALLLVAIGPGGPSAREVAALSDPFALSPPPAPRVPVGPRNVKIKSS